MEDDYKKRITKYTLRELLDVEASLDKGRYPDKCALLDDEIARRKSAGEYIAQVYTCPNCTKKTISHCDKQNSSGIITCRECGSQLYLDPYRSNVSPLIGIIGLGLSWVFESFWFILITLIVVILLRDKWVGFVSKDDYAHRLQVTNLLTYIILALISALLTLLFVFSDPSWVGPYQPELIAFCTISTLVLTGFSVNRYVNLQNRKN